MWFDEVVTGRSRLEIGIPATVDESFTLAGDDTVASVSAAHEAACAASRAAVADLALDDLLPNDRRGLLPLRWILLHVIRELAQHAGHADILPEQIPRDDVGVTG